MTTRSKLTRGAAGLAALAILAGLAVAPATASAQSYSPGAGGYDGGYRYDACQRERTGRGTGGALVGAGIGALAGGNIAAEAVARDLIGHDSAAVSRHYTEVDLEVKREAVAKSACRTCATP